MFTKSLEIIETLKKQSFEWVNSNKGCDHRAQSRRASGRGNYENLNSKNCVWSLDSQVEARCRQTDIVTGFTQLFQRLGREYTRECEKCYFTYACFSS